MLHFPAERLIAHRDRLAEPQHIADLEPGNRNRCGERAVEAALLEQPFTAEHFVADVPGEQVDGFLAAHDLQPVDREIPLVGHPAHLERAQLGQRFGAVDAIGDVAVGGDGSVLQPDLLVGHQQR